MKAHCVPNVPCTTDDCFYCPNIPHRHIGVKTDGSTTLRLHDKVYLAELKNILIKMALDMKDLDPEYSKTCDDHFWSLA